MDPELELVKRRMLTGGAAGVQAWLELVLGEAILEAPIDEGTLRGSGYVLVEIEGETVMGRAGFPLVYAARQHEELDWSHPRGGKPKYLEDPYKAHIPEFTPTVGAAVQRAL